MKPTFRGPDTSHGGYESGDRARPRDEEGARTGDEKATGGGGVVVHPLVKTRKDTHIMSVNSVGIDLKMPSTIRDQERGRGSPKSPDLTL